MYALWLSSSRLVEPQRKKIDKLRLQKTGKIKTLLLCLNGKIGNNKLTSLDSIHDTKKKPTKEFYNKVRSLSCSLYQLWLYSCMDYAMIIIIDGRFVINAIPSTTIQIIRKNHESTNIAKPACGVIKNYNPVFKKKTWIRK